MSSDSNLGDSIAKKLDPQKRMMQRFSKVKAIAFDTIDVRPQKSKAKDDKGLIVPKINYIEDEYNDERGG